MLQCLLCPHCGSSSGMFLACAVTECHRPIETTSYSAVLFLLHQFSFSSRMVILGIAEQTYPRLAGNLHEAVRPSKLVRTAVAQGAWLCKQGVLLVTDVAFKCEYDDLYGRAERLRSMLLPVVRISDYTAVQVRFCRRLAFGSSQGCSKARAGLRRNWGSTTWLGLQGSRTLPGPLVACAFDNGGRQVHAWASQQCCCSACCPDRRKLRELSDTSLASRFRTAGCGMWAGLHNPWLFEVCQVRDGRG